ERQIPLEAARQVFISGPLLTVYSQLDNNWCEPPNSYMADHHGGNGRLAPAINSGQQPH
ncbi:MAG: hypothetical protein Q9181_007909, partial [Wetmoreana brouardii]